MLSNLTNEELFKQLVALAQTERRITSQILDLLEEMDRRRSFLELGYPSLISFCTQELKYSESSAYRRIQAMRARRETPQIGPALIDGTLSLTVVAKAQSYLYHEEKKTHEKIQPEIKEQLYKELKNKSFQETERILFEKSPTSMITTERIRTVDQNLIEIKIFLESCNLEKLNRIRTLISNRTQQNNYTNTIQWMIDQILQKIDPQAKPTTSKGRPMSTTSGQRITIPTSLKQMVWKKSKGQCCYQYPKTGKRCDSRFWLEIDHIVPLAKGGSNDLSNLQLLCRAHNQWKGAD